MKRIFVVAISIVFFASATVQSRPAHAENHPLWQMYTALKSKKWVDLTQTFDTDTPHWKGFQAMTRKVLFDYDKDGFRAEEYCHVGQWGTHVDPPTHFHKGLRAQDQIDVKEMLMPLVVLRRAPANPLVPASELMTSCNLMFMRSSAFCMCCTLVPALATWSARSRR